MAELVGVSGVIGAGKDYLSTKLIENLRERGYTVSDTSFALPLKEELSVIISFVVSQMEMDISYSAIRVALTPKFNIPEDKAHQFLAPMYDELLENPHLNGWSRSPGVRTSLQFLGTDIRRSQDYNYWVRLFLSHVDQQKTDFVFVTDGRFPNEMDAVVDNGGLTFRLEIPEAVLQERRHKRDGFAYSEEALNHASETALDDYTRFDVFVGEKFDTDELVDLIVQQANIKK